MNEEKQDFYQNLRSKMKAWIESKEGKNHKWTEYLMFAPDLFHLLCRLSLDKDVLAKEKAKLAGAIAYFLSPIDLIPEAVTGPVGYVDDIAIAAYVINSIVTNSNADVVKKHWAGEKDVLEVIQSILTLQRKLNYKAQLPSTVREVSPMIFLLNPLDHINCHFDIILPQRQHHLDEGSKLRYGNRRCFFFPT